ncbi:uncharacterized protein LOC111499219 [Cucurbita maxima]|uniref:Uncharacterized protein LOC111499219 n=1 Tax=Cucurbita maxima TaxID=3661 RepID=A0A6J1L546_CUCMA|nr:uncharacterized protein LOC111499219 [Cucurbita maxima]
MESKLRAMASKRSSIVYQPRALQAGFLHLPRKKPKMLPLSQSNELASKDGDGVSDFVAKDLRLKRVFSPNLENRSSVTSGELISDKEGPMTANGTCLNEDSGVGKISEITEVRNENFCNSNRYAECDEVRKCNGTSGEQIHSTPPDVEFLAGGFVAASSHGCPRSSNGGVIGDNCAKADCRIDSVTRTGSVLKPCSKRKLFKAPGSIAYKRMLPFLLDSDNFTLLSDPYLKRENNLEKKENIESNLCNPANGSSFVDSDTCVKNAVFASGNACKTMKLDLPPPDNGDTKEFQNGSDLSSDPTLVEEGSFLKKDNVVCASFIDERPTKYDIEDRSSREQSKTSGMERLDGGNYAISEAENFKSHVSEKLCNNISEDVNREDHFNEELKMSLLDSNIGCNPVKEERRDEKVGCTRGADEKLGSSTVGENHCNIATESDKKYGTYVRNKMVRNPLEQLKLNYSQASVSYRRMLPFLEDLFKDNPDNCASGNINCPRPEKELPTMNLDPPSSNSHNSQDKSEFLVSCNMPCDGNSDALSMPLSNSINDVVCEADEVLMPAGVNDILLSPPISPPKLLLHSDLEMLEKCKLKMDPQLNDQAVSSSYLATSYEPLTGEGSRMTSKQSPNTSEDCTNLTEYVSDGTKLTERNSLKPVEACILPENHINIRKGILKRNRRGCRGICNCLNCSSFRLHAERAFEFSRNQLQDAEEVASDLMKELLLLRGVLEKYADSTKEGDAGYHSNKVKEACRKASEAELIAKDRLLQMNYELGIHCRITCSQRPNVRFSSEVERIEIEDGK